MMRLPKNWVTWCFFAFALGVTVQLFFFADHWRPGARTFPRMAAAFALFLVSLELLREYVPLLRNLLAPTSTMDLGFATDQSPREVVGKTVSAFAWLSGLTVAVFLIGFQAAVAGFMVLYLRMMSQVSWLKTIIISVAVWVPIFVVLDALMRPPWPEPWLLRYALELLK